jgi:hypothetical protein
MTRRQEAYYDYDSRFLPFGSLISAIPVNGK